MEELVHRPQANNQPPNFSFEFPLATPTVEAQPLSPQEKARSKIPSLITNANTLFKHSENELGFALVRQALKIDSHHPEVLKQLARFHHSQRNWASAAKALEAVIQNDYSFENLALLAEKYYLLGDDTKAFARYEEALSVLIDTSPLLFDIYKNLGNIHCRQGDYQAAEENYCKAFTINPCSDVLLINLGTLEVQKSEFPKALEKFRSALEVNPRNDKGWVGLAIVHDRMGDFDLAMANIENAVDLCPQNRTAVHILSAWATRDHKHEVAIEALENYLSQVDQDEEMSLALINLFCMTDQYEFARFEIERVLLWNPKQADVLELLEKMPRSKYL